MNNKHLSQMQIDSISSSQYQTIEAIGQAWKQLLEKHLPLPPESRVLDAGCGNGFLSILLAQMGWRVTALDQSMTAIEKAKENARRFHVEDRIDFCWSDTVQTPLEAGTYDAVLSRHASSLFLQPYDCYQEWHRLLKKGAPVVNYDANWLSPLWNDTLAKVFMEDEEKLREQVADYTDLYHDRFALLKLSQYPLAYEQRPEWDVDTCSRIGFQNIVTEILPHEGLLPPVLARRFNSIPMFMIKAEKI